MSVRAGQVTAPDSIEAGWARFRVEEDGGHILVVFRLPDTASDADVASFLVALDTTKITPAPGLALGGPEIGDTGTVLIALAPGRHVIACVVRGADGHRHVRAGEARPLWVVPVGAPRPAPAFTIDLALDDFAFVAPERWPAGPAMLRLENRGRQDHQLRLGRLRDGATLGQWMKADEPSDYEVPLVGMARIGPGVVAYLPVDLQPGNYVLSCLVADPRSGRQHLELGMFRMIHVD